MIVILCRSWLEAQDSFLCFLKTYAPELSSYITNVNGSCLSLTSDEDLTYIFIDYRYDRYFNRSRDDFVYVEDFFHDLDELLYYT